MKIFILGICISVFSAFTLVAQDCSSKIDQASIDYDQGKFDKVIESLKPCTEETDVNTVFRSHRLLAMAYLGKNNNEMARVSVIEMLRLNPNYKPDIINDPSNLVALISSVNIIPKFSLGISFALGSNTNLPEITSVYMLNNQTKTYSTQTNTQLSIASSFQLNKHLSIVGMARLVPKAYDLNIAFDSWDIDVSEQLNYLQVPLMLKVNPLYGKRIRPYLQAGAYTGFLLSTINSFYAQNYNSDANFSLINLSSYERRNNMEWGACVGGGLDIKLGNGILSLNSNYFRSMTNITSVESRYNHPEISFPFYYLDDDIKFHNLSISLGYALILNYKVLD